MHIWWAGSQFRCLTPYLVSSRSYFFHIKKLRRISTACSCLLELGCLFTHCASSRVCPIAMVSAFLVLSVQLVATVQNDWNICAAIMCVKSSCFANFQNYQKFGMCWYPFLLQNRKGANLTCIVNSQPSRENVCLKDVDPGKLTNDLNWYSTPAFVLVPLPIQKLNCFNLKRELTCILCTT